MIIYLAGVNNDYFASVAHGQNILTTFWETKKWRKSTALFLFRKKFKFKRLFLDCGAYSAWTQGKSIDLNEYMNYLKLNQGVITEYPQLDVKDDFKATVRNLKIMEAFGLNPIPVFHMTNMPVSYFKELVDSGYKRIAIGALAGEKGGDNSKKFEEMFDYIVDKKTGEVRCKLHAFGVTTLSVLLKYPFWSADSTSWLAGARFRQVFQFDQESVKMGSINTVEEYISKYGNIPLHLRNPKLFFSKGLTYLKRCEMSMLSYLELQDFVTKVWDARGIKFI